jgi:hypothetical protein
MQVQWYTGIVNRAHSCNHAGNSTSAPIMCVHAVAQTRTYTHVNITCVGTYGRACAYITVTHTNAGICTYVFIDQAMHVDEVRTHAIPCTHAVFPSMLPLMQHAKPPIAYMQLAHITHKHTHGSGVVVGDTGIFWSPTLASRAAACISPAASSAAAWLWTASLA